jgi:hypothetical protein
MQTASAAFGTSWRAAVRVQRRRRTGRIHATFGWFARRSCPSSCQPHAVSMAQLGLRRGVRVVTGGTFATRRQPAGRKVWNKGGWGSSRATRTEAHRSTRDIGWLARRSCPSSRQPIHGPARLADGSVATGAPATCRHLQGARFGTRAAGSSRNERRRMGRVHA